MQENDVTDALHKVVDELLGRNSRNFLNVLSAMTPPIDVSRPNEHDNKKQFLLELKAVEDGISHSKAIFSIFTEKDASEDVIQMRARLRANLDSRSRKSLRGATLQSAQELVQRNISEVGFSQVALLTLIDLHLNLLDRKQELKDQEIEFWTVSNRPPNYYARTIALRLARLYAKEKQQFPTFGTARDGGHPSTDFGRAVEKVFALLDINADIRSPVEWAIAQLTDDDIAPKSYGLLGQYL